MATAKLKSTTLDGTIAGYAKDLNPKQAGVCAALAKAIDGAMPNATSKIWHAIPVWFIGENPVVGYSAKPAGVTLLFWNGQQFDESALEPVGKFRAAQVRYQDVSQIDAKLLARWLRKAATNVWDLVGMRRQALAERKRA